MVEDYMLPLDFTRKWRKRWGNKKGDKDQRSPLDSLKIVMTSLFELMAYGVRWCNNQSQSRGLSLDNSSSVPSGGLPSGSINDSEYF
jgi:hypothetical protein